MIKITRIDGRTVIQNIYVAKVYFWSGSDVETRSDNIQQPITIKLSQGKVIDALVAMESRPGITKIGFANGSSGACGSVANSSAVLAQRDRSSIPLYWCVLDGNMGAVITVVYEAPKPADITMDGYVSGIRGVKPVSNREVEANVHGKELWTETWTLVLIFAGAVAIAAMLLFIRSRFEHLPGVNFLTTLLLFLMQMSGILVPVGILLFQGAVYFGWIGPIGTMPAAMREYE